MNKKFLKYYAPILTRGNKTAFILYCYYDAFKDSEGIVTIKIRKLANFLGLDERAVKKANRVLAGLALIEIIDKKIYCREVRAPVKESRVQAKSARVLCNDAAAQEKKVLRLLNLQFMKKLYIEMGSDQFRMKHILAKLEIDKAFFLEKKKDSRFLKKLKQVVKTVKEKDVKTDLYESLIKSMTAIPFEQWKSPQLLGYFVTKYEETFGTRFAFSSQNVFNSKEMRDIKRLWTHFTTPNEIKELINWFYAVKRKEPGIRSVGTGILVCVEMVNEFKQKKVTQTLEKRNKDGALDKGFLDWVSVHTPEILERFTLQTVEDLSWVVDAAKHGGEDSSKVAKKVIREARRRGIANVAN